MKGLFTCIFLCCFIPFAKAQLAGNSIQLKANGNYISVVDAASASLNDTMTIEMMLYYRCNNSQSTMLVTKGWCGSNWSYYFSVFDQKLRFARWNTAQTGCAGNHAIFESTDSIEVNTWTHVAVRIVDLNVDFFIDGAHAGSSLISGTNGDGFRASSQPLRIGAYLNLSSVYQNTPLANIDEFRIWHTARTDAELLANRDQELVGNEAGLIAYYKLNETGSGAGISVANSATGSPLPNGTSNGTASNILFTNNTLVQNTLPTCDPVLWLKADAGAYTNAGITLASDGQPVQQWNDQSGNAYHCAQADISKQPIWQANAFYGKPALWFDGVNGNYWLENATQTPVATAGMPRTYFVVAKAACDASGYAGGHLFTNRRSPNASTLEFVKNGSGIYHGGNFCCNHPEVSNVNFDDGRLQPFVATWRTGGTNTNLDFWFNGASKTTVNANFVADNGNAGYCVGDRRDAYQFDNPTGGYDWQGHIAEIIVYNYALTNKQRAAVENYLKTKYKANLPTVFTSMPNTSTFSTQTLNDAVWEHSFNTSQSNEIIASVKDYCLDLGVRSDTVYVEPTAIMVGTAYAMRRHYVVSTSLNPVGTKRVRLYYSNDDFTDLQSMVPSLNSHTLLCVTKYDGPNEDGVFQSAGGNLTLIPSSAITIGTLFGQRYLEFDVDGFSEFWIHTGNTPLPLDLISFSGIVKHQTAQLHWQTANMVNVRGFEVEKSSDAASFTSIGFVEATSASDYQFVDMRCYDKRNYYRLKMIDHDQHIAYSNVIHLLNTDQMELAIFPNPACHTLQLVGVDMQNGMDVKIYSMDGKLVATFLSSSTTIDVSKLKAGMYFIQLNNRQGESGYVKFVKS